ncbi:MAG TPA: hypothetical protein VK911_01630 [Vicinamibacterales bacterium]|nr:hypothetical protein [Vicinamibacterales bacterium]
MASSFAGAQDRGATLEVRVRNGSGARVAGLAVEAINETGLERYRCVTRADGACVLLAVAPGRYRLALGSGLDAAVPIDVPLGDHVVVRLTIGDGEHPLAARDGPSWDEEPRSEDLSRLPSGRPLLRALRIDGAEPAPGNWRLGGLPLPEMRIFLDGVAWPETPGAGEDLPLPVVLEAIQARTAGGNAGSARGTGASISVVTRAGGRRTQGDVSIGYEGWWLNGAPARFSRYSPWDRDRVESGLTVPPTPWTAVNPSAGIGGPLKPSGLSYYAAGSATRRTHHRDVIFLEDPDRERRRFSWFSWSGRATANLTAAPGRNARGRLALTHSRSRNRGGAPALEPDQGRLPDGSSTAGFTRAPFDDPPSALARWRQTGADSGRLTLSATFDRRIGGTASVSAGGTLSHSNSWTPEAHRSDAIRHVFATSNARVAGVPAADVRAAGYADHPSSYGTVRDRYRRSLFDASVTWSPARLASHLFSAGVRGERVSNDVYIGHARPTLTLYWDRDHLTAGGDRLSGAHGYYAVSRTGTIGRAAGTTTAVWWEDRWSPHDRVSAEVGLRAEREMVPSYARGAGVTRPAFGFAEKLAPRAAFQWRLDAAGRWKASASWGLFYDHLKVQLARSLFGGKHDVREYWTLDTLDWQALACDEGERGCPGRFIERVDGDPAWNQADPRLTAFFRRPATRVDPRLKPMRTGEWTAGVDRRLTARTSLSIRYTGKWLARAVEDVGVSLPGVGESSVLANPGFGYARQVWPAYPAFPLPAASRRYRSVEVEARRRTQRLSAALGYRWSGLTGNYGGLAAADEGGRESTNTTAAFDALYSSYDRNGQPVDGPLPGDRPHRLDADAAWLLPCGTTIALAGLIESGRPESSELLFRGATVYFNGYGDLGRQPVYSQLDLRLRHDVRLGGQRRLTLEATFDNLLDRRTPIAYFSNSPYRDSLALPEAAFFQPPWDPAEWVATLRNGGASIRDEQLFLVPDRFQRARQVTLAAALRF